MASKGLMFRKRVKKEFPPGTFIPTPARVMAILQLSLGLLLLIWQLSQPFMGELFAIRSKMAVYEYVMGTRDGSEMQQRNAARFQQLPVNLRTEIIHDYSQWQDKLQESFWHKLKRAFEGVLFHMPLFEKMWLLLSLVIPILILLKVEGSIHAAWLIPLVVFAYAVDNRWYGEPKHLSPELQLFPTEAYLMHTYAEDELDPNPFNQKEQLQASWELYLIKEWTQPIPGTAVIEHAKQVEEGEYAFTTARALAIKKDKEPSKPVQESNALLIVYLLWNIAFAYVVSKNKAS